jgi:glycosyltransferase involved in cell wall biosynthesis
VRLLARVSHGQLKWLYQNARAFLFPSLDEGFGLPPLEALYFGCPVIASDIPVLRETLSSDAHFVDSRSVTAFARCIAEIVSGDAERLHLPPERFPTWRRSVELMRAALVAQNGPA